jgi:hypothetical protein
MHPTALHCTSTFGEFICLISGANPPKATIATLFSAESVSISLSDLVLRHTVYSQVSQRRTRSPLHLDVRVLKEEQYGLEGITIDFPHICQTRSALLCL